MRSCRWCGKEGDWPSVCMSTHDMEDKPNDPRCLRALLEAGGGERTANQKTARELLAENATNWKRRS